MSSKSNYYINNEFMRFLLVFRNILTSTGDVTEIPEVI